MELSGAAPVQRRRPNAGFWANIEGRRLFAAIACRGLGFMLSWMIRLPDGCLVGCRRTVDCGEGLGVHFFSTSRHRARNLWKTVAREPGVDPDSPEGATVNSQGVPTPGKRRNRFVL